MGKYRRKLQTIFAEAFGICLFLGCSLTEDMMARICNFTSTGGSKDLKERIETDRINKRSNVIVVDVIPTPTFRPK